MLIQLSHIEADSDLEVRKHAAKLLLDLVDSCRTPRCLDVIGVLHKVYYVQCHRNLILHIQQYRSGTANSNTVNSKFHLIRSFNQDFARFLSFHV